MTEPFLKKVLFTGYRPEAAIQVIPMLANFFLKGFARDEKFRHHIIEELRAYLVDQDNPRNGAVCAWLENKLIGAVFIDASTAETQGARIRWFVVDENYRGKGIGRQLFERAIDYCKTHELDRIILKTYKGDPLTPFYERLGFAVFDERGFDTGRSQIVEQWFQKVA